MSKKSIFGAAAGVLLASTASTFAQTESIPTVQSFGTTLSLETGTKYHNVLENEASDLEKCLAYAVVDHAVPGGRLWSLARNQSGIAGDPLAPPRYSYAAHSSSYPGENGQEKNLGFSIKQDGTQNLFVNVHIGKKSLGGTFNLESNGPINIHDTEGTTPAMRDAAQQLVTTAREKCGPNRAVLTIPIT